MEVQLACWENLTCHQRRTEMSLAAEEREDRAIPFPRATLPHTALSPTAAASPAEEVESKSGERWTA